MKCRLITLLLLGWVGSCTVQAQEMYKYWVAFTDKAGSPYTLEDPSQYLGSRALERRRRQGIAVDSLDLPVSPSYVAQLQQSGFIVQNRSKWLNGVVLFSADSLGPEAFRTFPFVSSAVLCDHSDVSLPDVSQPNYGSPIPYQPMPQPFSAEYYAGAWPQIRQLNGHRLHASGYQGQGMIIGVCDCGFPGVDTAAIFAPMCSEGRLLATRDFVWTNSGSVFNIHSHGTHALSTMAAFAPGLFVGTAPMASYVLCRTESVMSETLLEEYNWAAAAEYLDSLGADIVSSSLGYFVLDDSAMSHTLADLDGRTTPISRAAAVAGRRGMLVVNSAAGGGRATPQHLNAPADVPEALSVGAVDRDGIRAPFSAYGPTATGCIKPDVLAMGVEVLSACPDGLFRPATGTSVACPVMAGMMACLWQRFPSLTPAQLCDSVRAWGSLSQWPTDMEGYGIPDFARAVPAAGLGSYPPEPESVRLAPNPATGVARLRLGFAPQGAPLRVVDAMGREVFSCILHSSDMEIPTHALPRGLYVVEVATPGGRVCRRLVVQ